MATKEKTEKKKKSGGSTGSKKAPSVSLAVKYRPRTLDDLVGQDAVSTQVRGMIKTGRFPPTLGLFGESGAGKTTTARMIARYINCLKPSKEGTPCGECSSCEYSEHHPDVHEINMANERGIDDARNLINSARSMPVIGNKRIFILDEMHACFPADTEILMADGSFKTMGEIIERDDVEQVVRTCNTETGELSAHPVITRMPKTARPNTMVRVHIGDGAYQDCTEDHKWWSVTRNKYVRADELMPGEQLLVADEAPAE